MKQELKELLSGKELFRTFGVIIGALLYVIGMNLFIVPAGIYSGGVIGLCQVIRTILIKWLHFPFTEFDIAGILYYFVNIPIMYIAYKSMGKLFFIKTAICMTTMTAFFTLIPIPSEMIVTDSLLTCSMIGGIISGVGCGLSLMMGGCSGGMDILGVYFIKKNGRLSVGQVNLIMNLCIYMLCMFLFNIQTVIYSIIFAWACSIAVDKVHAQNINVEVIIITRINTRQMQLEIMKKLQRGITQWDSKGAFTQEASQVYYIILSKYEVNHLRNIVHQYDPEAFVVVKEGVTVSGNYTRKM